MNQATRAACSCPSRRRLAMLEKACGPVRLSTIAPLRSEQPLIAVVSSRLGHDRFLHREVCRRLSRSVLECRCRGGTLLVARGSAIAPWASRAAELLGVRQLEVSVNRERFSDEEGLRIESASDGVLSRDQAVIALADRVDALFVRRGGKIARYLEERLRLRDDATTRVATSGDGRCAAAELIASGAIGWYLPPAEEHGSAPASRQSAMSRPVVVGTRDRPGGGISFAKWPESPEWTQREGEWLVHCTRARDAEWPGQTRRQYLDWMLLGSERLPGRQSETVGGLRTADAFETLRRIVRSRRLIAGCGSSSRGHPVVCFSAVSLAELLSRRCYRPHLHRWDYEPYGVAVQLRAAVVAGVKPVIYGDPSRRRDVPLEDRYRFQPRGRTYDWTAEREWRSPHDFDLSRCDPTAVRVFVPSDAEASQLAPLCPWPISVVPSGVSGVAGSAVDRSSGIIHQ